MVIKILVEKIDKKKIGNIIKKERLELHLTQEELAIKLGLNNKSSVSQYEKGDAIPSDDIKLSMCELFNCSIDYLLGKSDVKKDKSSSENKENLSSNMVMLPVYGEIAAGLPNWAIECLEGYLPLDPNFMNILNPNECFFLRVNGESMNKVISNGAYALIRKQDIVNNGEIAVVLVDNYNATLKRFSKTGDIVILSPESDSDEFKPLPVNLKETTIKILGKYIGKFEING